MTAIEQHIEATRKAINLELDQLLEKVRGNAAFLAEMNATNDHEPQAEYGVSMLVEAPPSIPDLEGVEMTKEQYKTFANPTATPEPQPSNQEVLVERFGLEETGEAELSSINDALWLRFVKTIMLAGWTLEKLKASEPCRNVVFTKAESEVLKNLECLRFSMKGKDIDLNQALGQDWVTTIEADVIREFATTNKLK